MPLVSQSTVSYKGGVSQQPDIIRFADQVEEQINGFSSEVDGLQKRPPTVHIKRLGVMPLQRENREAQTVAVTLTQFAVTLGLHPFRPI